jgi:HlyD family secretion protein
MKKLLIILLSVVLIGISFYIFNNKKSDTNMKFKTDKVTLGEIRSTVTATGALNAITTVNVGAQISGKIKELYVDFNSTVKKDQIIALIEPTTFIEQVNQYKANLAIAQANFDKATVTYNDAKRIFDREAGLFKKDYTPRSSMETAETNFLMAKAGIDSAKAQIDQAKAILSVSETNLMYTKIVSPVSGTVISRNVDVGQTVVSSLSAPTLFTIAKDLTKMQINTNIVEADIGRIKEGLDVEFTVDAYPDLTFKGTVFQVRNAPTTIQNVVTYDVMVKVDNDKLLLKPGMTANVSILISKKENILRIPNAALRFTPFQGRKKADASTPKFKGKGVWILEHDKPKRINIKTGISDSSYTELISDELKEGQELIVESLNQQKPPQPMGPRMF